MPVEDIVAAFKARKAAATGIGISGSTAAPSRNQLRQLRRAVLSGIPFLVGGQGARRETP